MDNSKDEHILVVNYGLKPYRLGVYISRHSSLTGLVEYDMRSFKRIRVRELCQDGDAIRGRIESWKLRRRLEEKGINSPDTRILDEMLDKKRHLIPQKWKDNRHHWFLGTLYCVGHGDKFRESLIWGNHPIVFVRGRNRYKWYHELSFDESPFLLDDFIVVV